MCISVSEHFVDTSALGGPINVLQETQLSLKTEFVPVVLCFSLMYTCPILFLVIDTSALGGLIGLAYGVGHPSCLCTRPKYLSA